MKAETPIRRQYLEIKAKHKNALLLFRLGDFYESFDDDARILAKELDIVLTSKPMGKDLRVPLAGIPYHSLERHLATLISRGHRVAICEQTSTSPVKGKDGKKLIEREVVRTVTAGTIIEPSLLDRRNNNYLASFFSDGINAGIAYADITTGEFFVTEIENKNALTELARIAPSEILIVETEEKTEVSGLISKLPKKFFAYETARKALFKHFQTKSLQPFGLEKSPLAVSAAGALLAYLRETQTQTVEQLTRLKSYDSHDFMLLDAHTLRSLEIFESATNSSLLSVIDRTQTPMGSRLLRRWLRQPLLDTSEIYRRQDQVSFFKENKFEREKLSQILAEIKDLERLSGRAKMNLISAYELLSFGKSLELLPKIKEVLRSDTVRFGQMLTNLPNCENVAKLIESAISNDLPSVKNESIGIIRQGFSAELDKLRTTLKDGKGFLAEMEIRERQRTGIKSLRVAYNKVFGYFIEVTKPNLHLVPTDYFRKQTLVPAERFVTLELKEYESLVVHAQERIEELENSLFRQVCQEIGKSRQKIQLSAQIVAYLDVIVSLAEVADQNNYCRPQVNDTSLLRIKNGRHAVIEQNLQPENIEFVANDSALGGINAPQIALITGPNASGKSTYLRQIALIVLLAQIGSFVPADEAVIGTVNRIFTRIGLYDRIGLGESTFMTEMIETAEILHHATPNSLILLDELGRGTSTFDGLAVARSVIEFIHNHPNLKTRTLFATHYHELAELENLLPRLENLHFEIEENADELIFKYKVNRGVALKSYGVYAAKLAGLPKPVIRRAEELLKEYEVENSKFQIPNSKFENQSEIETILRQIDVESLSPVEALMKLYELKKRASEKFISQKLKIVI
jgi:DNA mismatch repair protein MutS